MSILEKYLPFVKEQYGFHEIRVTQNKVFPHRAKKHQETADTFRQLEKDLIAASGLLDAPPAAAPILALPKNLRLTPEEIADLPKELVSELSISAGDRTEFAILNLLEEAGGITSLDRILVGLYKTTGEIHKRERLTSRLWRMSQKNMIYNVPGKKGVYSIDPPPGYEPSEFSADAASEEGGSK